MALNTRQLRFIEEYLLDLNATQAAIRAGYGPQAGPIIMRTNPEVRAAAEAALAERSGRAAVRADEVLMELKRLAFADPVGLFEADGSVKPLDQMPAELRRAIASIDVTSTPKGAKVTKIKLCDKVASLDKLMRHLGLYKDKLEITTTASLREILSGKVDQEPEDAEVVEPPLLPEPGGEP